MPDKQKGKLQNTEVQNREDRSKDFVDITSEVEGAEKVDLIWAKINEEDAQEIDRSQSIENAGGNVPYIEQLLGELEELVPEQSQAKLRSHLRDARQEALRLVNIAKKTG